MTESKTACGNSCNQLRRPATHLSHSRSVQGVSSILQGSQILKILIFPLLSYSSFKDKGELLLFVFCLPKPNRNSHSRTEVNIEAWPSCSVTSLLTTNPRGYDEKQVHQVNCYCFECLLIRKQNCFPEFIYLDSLQKLVGSAW